MSATPSTDPEFRRLFAAHHRELHAFCLRRLPIEAANDAVAEIFLAAWRRLDLVSQERTRPWLYRLARSVVTSWRHRHSDVPLVVKEGVTVPAAAGGYSVQIVRHPDHEMVHQALASLREIDREIVQLEAWEGLGPDEIAEILGSSRRRVERRRARSIEQLTADRVTSHRWGEGPTVHDRVGFVDSVPSPDAFPTSAWSSGVLLSTIDERSTHTDDNTLVEMDTPTGGGRGILLALLVAGLGLFIVMAVAMGLVGFPEGATPPNTAPAPPTTFAAPTTTSLPPDPFALPVDTPAVEVVETMYRRWEAADIVAYRALIEGPAAGYNLPSFDHAAWYHRLSGVTVIRSCRFVDLDVVRCESTYYSGMSHGKRLIDERADFTVQDAMIVRIDPREEFGLFNVGFDRDGLFAYRGWVLENEPERFDELFTFGTSILLHTPQLRDVHADLMDRYREATARAGALSDAMPIKVVDTYYGRRLAGDVAGYRELVATSSAGAESLVPTDEETWYFDVTGMAIGRVCDSTTAVQVTCDETYYSGLAPGVELSSRSLRYTVIDGTIVDVESLAPVESFVTADEAALERYRAWLGTNDPAARTWLFTAAGTMVLDTETSRTAHEAHVADYRESQSG